MTTTTTPNATAYALADLEALAGPGVIGTARGRAAYLALAALCDRALDSPNGLDAVPAYDVAVVLGVATDTARRTLRALATEGHAVLVADTVAGRQHLQGARAAERLAPARIRGYRLTEEAWA